MICTKVLGKVEDFNGKRIDYVDIEWDEAFKKRHRKVSGEGEDVGIRMDDEIHKTGLRQGDVLFCDEDKVIAVNIPETEAIEIHVAQEHPEQIAKLCYEVGNTHITMFRGEDLNTFYVPYYDALLDKIERIEGVSAKKTLKAFDFDRALSGSINNHHH